jgi:KDO2-lipid IV(A) lauroyltransferase
MARVQQRILRRLLPALNTLAGAGVSALLTVVRTCNRIFVSNLFASVTRTLGPLLREQRIGRANLKAAFPEKSDAEIERILKGVWDNLGRVAAEFAHVDLLCEGDPEHRKYIEYAPGTAERFKTLRDDGKPALIFAAHTGNWELPAVLAAADGLDTLVLYRKPNLEAVADAVLKIRSGNMGEMVATSLSAPMRLANGIAANRHVAMLVDQHYVKGVDVRFFGRTCKANPLVAMLARESECAIHGTRVIRLPNGKFRAEVTEAVPPARDAEGRIDVQGTMQAITSVIEGWVREYPEQWLWLHRRWR